MAASTSFQDRAARVKERLDAAGISQAEAARQIGYRNEAGTVYVRRVLAGVDASNPVLDRIEAFLDRHQREHEAA